MEGEMINTDAGVGLMIFLVFVAIVSTKIFKIPNGIIVPFLVVFTFWHGAVNCFTVFCERSGGVGFLIGAVALALLGINILRNP